MRETKVASRYAKSILDLALEQGVLEQVKMDMELVFNTCNENRELGLLLSNPIVKTDKKVEILKMIFGGNLSNLSFKFIEIIASRKREEIIPVIAETFLSQYKEYKKIITAVVTTTVGLDDHLRNKVLDLVKAVKNQEIELIEKLDKTILGGFVLNIGDKRIDSSVLAKLTKLKRNFKENPYIKEF